MGSTPVSDGDSIEQRLTHTLRCLVEDDNHRGVVRLVERWAQLGGLTDEALVAQARAFMSLRLMDRAWVRLQEARERDPEQAEVQLLTAEMFIERGWPARARRILERVAIDSVDPDRLDRLRQVAAQPPIQPPENANEIERTAEPDALLALAERYMAAGSFMRAESLLERLSRDGNGSDRVSDLIWGMRGDYVSQKQSVDDLLRELSPDDWLSEWEGIDRTESLRAIEDTVHDPEAAARELLGESGDRDEGRPAFPNLFRQDGVPDDTTLGDDDEVTVASMMATTDQMSTAPAFQHTDPGISQTGDGGDTRIMPYISKEGGELSSSSASGKPKVGSVTKPGAGVGSTLDLRAQSDASLDADPFLEEEDQDLIVMTRRERLDGPSRSRAPVSVPSNIAQREGRRSLSAMSRPQPVAAAPPPSRAPAVSEPLRAEPDTEELVRRRRWKGRRFIQLVSLMAVALATIGVLLWIVFFGLQQMVGNQVVEDAHATLGTGVFRAVQEEEARLETQVAAQQSPFEIRVVELALVRIILWSEYTGDTERLVAAQDGLQWARENGAPPEEVALAMGFLRLAMGDVHTAQNHAALVNTDSAIGRELVMRVALARGEPAAMANAWERVGRGSRVSALTEKLTTERLASVMGDTELAQRLRGDLLSKHGDNPFVQLARFERGWVDTGPREMLTALSAAMSTHDGLWSPRQEGRIHGSRARILADMGLDALAMDAWQKALIVDPTHPVYLYIAAGAALWQGRVLAALDDLNRCLGGRPWDEACRRGHIQALIDLDRLQTARQTVDSWSVPGQEVSHLVAWVALAEGRYKEAMELLKKGQSAEEPATGLPAYVLGMAMARLGQPEGDGVLEGVVSQMADASDPLDRILAARAEAVRMPLTDSTVARRLEARAIEIAPSDPVVQVEIGRYLETHRRKVDAAGAFDLAARIGQENALAHHARGLFYYDPKRDIQLARAAWQRYLELQPDGERAERIRSRVGWR